jgi:hypothetical protein
MSFNQIDMFETHKPTPQPIGGYIETFEQHQNRCRGALIYWLDVKRIHAKPGELFIDGDPGNGAWIDSWLIPSTQAGILDKLGGMAAIW